MITILGKRSNSNQVYLYKVLFLSLYVYISTELLMFNKQVHTSRRRFNYLHASRKYKLCSKQSMLMYVT